MNKASKKFQNLMLISLVMVVVDILVGVLLMNYFDFTEKIFSIIIGSVILLHGLFYAIRYLYDGLGKKVFTVDIISAVVCVIIGLLQIFGPFTSYANIGLFYGIHLIAVALEKGYFGHIFFTKKDETFPLVFFISILLIVMAIFVIINPFERFMLSTKLTGMFMICSGLLDALVCVLFRNRAAEILKLFK
jgi:uncharacterized membrane protein HdeD (DUF308 family)